MRRVATVVSVAMVATFVLTAPASALICARDPDLTPASVVGSKLETDLAFSQPYDFAVVGTVESVTTNEVSQGEMYGRTEIEVDVTLWLGGGTPSPSVVISTNDPGWMSGWPYEVGEAYFIPIRTNGPQGQVNYSFACDPIFEIEDAAEVAAELVPVAESAELDHTLYPPAPTPDEAPEPGTTIPPPEEVPTTDVPIEPEAQGEVTAPDPTVPWAVIIATTGTVLLLLLIGWRILHRQR